MTDTDTARAALSEMIEITETTIGQTFHRHPDLDALYRDCPTAFWLAPDADLTIPALPTVAATPESTLAAPGPVLARGQNTGIFRALIVAGPAFSAVALALAADTAGETWWAPYGRAAASLIAAPLTVLVGAVLGLIPILFGTLVLAETATTRRALQRPWIWLGTGGLMGVAISALFGASGPIGLALVATSVLCAGVARHAVSWQEEAFA